MDYEHDRMMEKFSHRRDKEEKRFRMASDLITKKINEETELLEDWKYYSMADEKDLEPKIQMKTEELNQLRRDISQIKGNRQEEDPDFNIDLHTINVFGDTILIFAAQNNDIKTCEMCIKIGATPTIMNEDGLSAIDYSHRFNFEEVTDLLLQVGVVVGFRQVLFLCLTISTLIFSHRMAAVCQTILGASSRKWSL